MHALDVLGDPVRRRILELLSGGERSAGEIVEVISTEFAIGQPAVSMQLRVLREAGFTHARAEGRRRIYALATGPFAEVDIWLSPFRASWEQHRDTLGTWSARGPRRPG